VTTEGGLDVEAHRDQIQTALERLNAAGIRTSLFIDPTASAAQIAHELGAAAIELHTGQYANAPEADRGRPLAAIREAARTAAELGLAVHAGHGLTVANVGPVAAVEDIEELNIGHSIVSRAIMIGIAAAVREMRAAMDENRDAAR
jgi:pyridoxine 5-phosphate synthase